MILKLIIISIILLAIAGVGLGIKLFFDKNAKPPIGSCRMLNDGDSEFQCGCGADACARGEESSQ